MRVVVVIGMVAFAVAIVLGGAAPFGRLALSVGLPNLAAMLFDDPDWRGIALYRADRMDEAAAAFREARAFYNLGNAEAHRGRHAAALEAYDLSIAGGDDDARANFDLISAFYAGLGIDPAALGLFPERKDGPEMDSFVGQGDGRAAGTGDEVTNANTMLGLAELDSRGRLGVRRIFDDAFMVANDRWLAQLSDVPGEFLAARIAHERKRRAALGLAPPDPEDPR